MGAPLDCSVQESIGNWSTAPVVAAGLGVPALGALRIILVPLENYGSSIVNDKGRSEKSHWLGLRLIRADKRVPKNRSDSTSRNTS
jgi:hypothetical protein